MTRIYFGILLVASMSGCIEQRRVTIGAPDAPDAIDSDGTSTEPDAASGQDTALEEDIRIEPDMTPSGPPEIIDFYSNFDSITRGLDSRNQPVDGSAVLQWRTADAATIEILADGLPISLETCIRTGSAPCAVEGSLEVRPARDTQFTLRALGTGGQCAGACPEQSVDVAVKMPVRVFMHRDNDTFEPGAEVAVPFVVENALDYTVGVLGSNADGQPTLYACGDAASPGDEPCTVDAPPESAPDTTGLFRVAWAQRTFTVGFTATNGAADGRGDLSLGDLDFVFSVPVVVHAFTATPAAFLPGDEVVLAWDVGDAMSVSVSTESTAFSGLSTCVGLGDDGKGFCTLTANASAPLGQVRFVLTALQEGGMSGEAQATVDIIAGPRVAAFASALPAAVPEQTFELSWTAFAADAVAIVAEPSVINGLDACTGVEADGRGSCTVSVAAGASSDSVALTLTASNRTVGPAATASAGLSIFDAPSVVSFGFDDDTRMAGQTATLAWITSTASSVQLQAKSDTISQQTLEDCTAGEAPGGGSCTIQLPEGLSPGEIQFSLVAVGPTGARSEVAAAVLTIGEVPVIEFMGTPDLLPEGGGTVALSWVAVKATEVLITDNGVPANSVVDTRAGTLCGDGQPCDPAGDTIAVGVAQPVTFTLVARNDFGERIATTAVSIEGAPFITDLRIGNADAMSGPVGVSGASATLAWTIDNLDGPDQVIVQRAPITTADGSCAALLSEAWTTIAGFPVNGVAVGSVALTGLTATAQCFRVIAEDVATTPRQRDVVTFKIYRVPLATAFAAADQTLCLGDVVDLFWETNFANRVAVTVSPVGAVTSQDLGRCVAANGGCAVTIQPGTPLGELVFTLVATGEASSATGPRTTAVTIGNAARVGTFTADPGALTEAGDVALGWTTTNGSALTVRAGGVDVYATASTAAVSGGTFVVPEVTATTTWTLTVENAFGSDSAEVTTFVGASIDSLTVNGGSALDGEERVITGPVNISWSTTSADGFHRLESAPAPANGNCNATGLAWTTRYLKDSAVADAASHADGVLTSNRCYRLTVANSQVPPQRSQAVFLVREMPEIASFVTSPSRILTGGGTVIIDAGVRGATTLTMTAEYRNAAGSVVGTRDVCTQSTLNDGTLTGGAAIDQVSCAHTVVACNLLCLNYGMPASTSTVRYLVTVADQEGDGANVTTAGGEDVTVN